MSLLNARESLLSQGSSHIRVQFDSGVVSQHLIQTIEQVIAVRILQSLVPFLALLQAEAFTLAFCIVMTAVTADDAFHFPR